MRKDRVASVRSRNKKKRLAWVWGMAAMFLLVTLSEEAWTAEAETAEAQIQAIQSFRKARDDFFKHSSNSPLEESERAKFKGLHYYGIDLRYRFEGRIERYIININNPKYYATFLTNKGTKKRYIRYGKFRFQLEGRTYSVELYKSILGDNLFIPFYDKTNGKETYEGGRYLDSEILMPGYRMVLDFNYAYNPSCAYNEKFVCVLPLEENRLDVEIRAGEKKFR